MMIMMEDKGHCQMGGVGGATFNVIIIVMIMMSDEGHSQVGGITGVAFKVQ